MATFPKDQFDDLPEDLDRVGAHRGPAKKGGGWIAFAWAALATGVLIIGGLYGVTAVTGEGGFVLPWTQSTDEAVSTPEPSVIQTADPVTKSSEIKKLGSKRNITITVLNGTAEDGLEETAFEALDKKKWPVTSAAPASADDITKTIVYYSQDKNEDVARGIVEALGVGDVRQSTAFKGAKVTIVLGSDYADLQAG